LTIYNTEIKNIGAALKAVENKELSPAGNADVDGHW
jgi:hypothetical protein